MQHILNKLYAGTTLSQQESHLLFQQVIHGQIDPVQLAAAIVSMKVRGEQPEEIAGAANALLEDARDFAHPDYDFADIVGTGGDGSNSINISTASAFVAAACGIPVAKHGNRGVSSRSGSSDVLAALGINLDMSPEESRQALDDLGVCFLFAQQYHQGFKYAAPVRQLLKTRTIFNVLGPLINPARPPYSLIGVYSPHLVKPVAETLRMLGYRRAAVVHGQGMDEVAVHGATQVAELYDNQIIYYQVMPEDFGLHQQPLSALEGGDPKTNRRLLTQLLQGKGTIAHETAVAINVAMLMRIFGQQDLRQNAEQALTTIRSGKAFDLITRLAARG